jgi:hypothetical protein
MKTSTIVILVAAGVGGAYLLTRKASATRPASPSGSSPFNLGGLLSGAESLIGKLTSHDSSSPQSTRDWDLTNVLDYDSQGTTDAPAIGIAGLDF